MNDQQIPPQQPNQPPQQPQPPYGNQPTTPLPPQQAPQAQAPQTTQFTQPGQPGGPGQPGQPGGPGAPYPPQQPIQQPAQPEAPMNTMAIVAFIASFFIGLLGIILGHISLSQIKKRGERGRGLALAGTIIGYVVTIGTIIAVASTIIFSVLFVQEVNRSFEEFEESSGIEFEELQEFGEELEGLSEAIPDDMDMEALLSGEEPWKGTDREEFCDLLMGNSDVDYTADQLDRLADLSTDRDLSHKLSDLSDRVNALPNGDIEEDPQLVFETIGVFTESLTYCMQE